MLTSTFNYDSYKSIGGAKNKIIITRGKEESGMEGRAGNKTEGIKREL